MRKALTVALISTVLSAHAQQLMQYTQFMFNRQVANPAYAGFTGDQLQASLLGKWQWSGTDGAPRTKTLAVDSYLEGKKMGLGLVINRDEITVFSTTTVQVNYAYQVIMSDRQRLALGLSGSFSNFSARYSDLTEISPDPTLSGNVSDWSPNFGFGAYYTLGDFNVGFSIPFLLSNTLRDNNEAFFTQRNHYFVTAGYAFQANANIRVEPNILLKMVTGSPVGIDANALTWFKEVVAVGLGYRHSESVDLLLQFKPASHIRLGYSYDHIIGRTLSSLGNSSHEVMLSYTIPGKKSKNKDSDGDGVPDAEDDCPTVAGSNGDGCPPADADGDGVPNAEDQCPDIKGSSALQGCPDSDGDGVSDLNDKCPDRAGTDLESGCPDSDGDGMTDDIDKCPEDAGTRDREGCPEQESVPEQELEQGPEPKTEARQEPKEEVKQILPQDLSAVRFHHNSDKLRESAQETLTKAAAILNDNPNCRLVIMGHTDDTGGHEINQTLSKMRAERVREYLAQMGVDTNRMSTEGYGEEKPMADNNTKEGRALNRRVELETPCKED